MQHRCGLVDRTRRWALALRPEHHPRSDQSGHVEQPACRTRCPKEPHAQRSWHLQRSPPAQSEDLPSEVWWPRLSPTTSGSFNAERSSIAGFDDCAALDDCARRWRHGGFERCRRRAREKSEKDDEQVPRNTGATQSWAQKHSFQSLPVPGRSGRHSGPREPQPLQLKLIQPPNLGCLSPSRCDRNGVCAVRFIMPHAHRTP